MGSLPGIFKIKIPWVLFFLENIFFFKQELIQTEPVVVLWEHCVVLLIILLFIIVRTLCIISKLIYSSLPSGTLTGQYLFLLIPSLGLSSMPHNFLLINRRAGISSIQGFLHMHVGVRVLLPCSVWRLKGALSPPVHLAQEQFSRCTLCWVSAALWRPQPGPS